MAGCRSRGAGAREGRRRCVGGGRPARRGSRPRDRERARHVAGIEGKVTIDATNAVRGRNEDFESNAHEIKSIVGGSTAKSFNLNFANLYDEIGRQRVRPSNLYCAEDEAREPTEQLIRDAGYDPVNAGGLEQARMLEDHLALLFAVNQAGLGPFFVRYARPGEL